MDRRTLLATAAGLIAGSALPAPASAVAAPAGAGRRNVLLLIADDQGLDVGCYGTDVKTPHIDALARRGTRFSQAYAAVSSCSPSRSVLYTGLYAHSNGMYGLAHDVHNQSLLDGVETLPLLLRKAGYATALVGKKHVRPDSAFAYDAELAPERGGIRDVAFIASEAARFVRGIGDRPFFLTIGYSDPHRAATDYGNKPWPKIDRVTYDPASIRLPAHLPDLPEVRRDVADYYESVSRLDSGIGLLLDELKAAGHGDDTLIIYLSDNGRPFPGAKTNLYDSGLHLPLIISAPGVGRPGIVNDAMVSWIDIVPTILQWTGAQGPGRPLPGRSLLPLLGQRNAAGWDAIYASHEFHEISGYYPMRAIRTRTHAYITNLAHPLDYPIAGDVASSPSWKALLAHPEAKLGRRTQAAYLKRPAEELYDLRTDPEELVNLAGTAEARPILEDLRARLLSWRKETADPWLAGQTSPYAHIGG